LEKDALANGCEGVDVVFHCAANLDPLARYEDVHAINVTGTELLLNSAKEAGVGSFVHVSTEAVLSGNKIHNADETMPYSEAVDGVYARTKLLAEQAVWGCCPPSQQDGMRCTIVRPRLVWGVGDRTILPAVLEEVANGSYVWLSGGHYLTSTAHVRNVVEGMLLAAEKAPHGSTYFLTDGEPVEFREFFTQLIRTHQVDTDAIGSVPYWAARAFIWASEQAHSWNLAGPPKVTGAILEILGKEVTVNDAKARHELGYRANVSIERGIAELADTYAASKA
jgi:nucleoside-diphosphate-sugar epimerase